MKPKQWYRVDVEWFVRLRGHSDLFEWVKWEYGLWSENDESALQYALEYGMKDCFRDGLEEIECAIEAWVPKVRRFECLGNHVPEFHTMVLASGERLDVVPTRI